MLGQPKYIKSVRTKAAHSKWNVRPAMHKYIQDHRILHQRGLHNQKLANRLVDACKDFKHAHYNLTLPVKEKHIKSE